MVFGEVINRKEDPTQSGKARVKWNTGGVNQSRLQEDDLQWSHSAFPVSNPSLKHIGGMHTGLMEGSKVIGLSPTGDGQNIIIIGTMPAAGTGSPDGQPNFDSDIPIAAKSQDNGGRNQPEYGDHNKVVTDESIVKFAQDEGGPEKKAARFPDLDDPIGLKDEAMEA